MYEYTVTKSVITPPSDVEIKGVRVEATVDARDDNADIYKITIENLDETPKFDIYVPRSKKGCPILDGNRV